VAACSAAFGIRPTGAARAISPGGGAFLAGNYDGGEYKGEMYGRNGVFLGYMRGRYMGEDGLGLFQGAWRQACVTDPPPPCLLTAAGMRVCDPIALPEPTG
jgi:hypothetical protein